MRLRVVLPVTLLFVSPILRGDLLAQACLGLPTEGGQGFLQGEVGFAEDGRSYGATGGYDSSGVLTAFVGGSFIDFEDSDVDAYGVAGGLHFEIPNLGFSLCPGGGVGYAKVEDLDISTLTFPVGAGVGGKIATEGGVSVIPFVHPQLLIIRVEVGSFSDTETEFGTILGVSLAGSRVYGGVALSITTIEDDDVAVSLGIGTVF